MNVKVVVARFKEDISWVSNLKHEYVIFNKNEDDNSLFQYNLINKGREGHTFTNYIVDNYDSLPDYVIFLQGNPFDHCKTVIEKINEFDFTKDFYPLGCTYIRDIEDILEETKKYSENFGIELNEQIKFISGAQCIVSKKLILKRNKESYEKIRDSFPNVSTHQYSYYVEYLWPTILNFNNELEITLYNC